VRARAARTLRGASSTRAHAELTIAPTKIGRVDAVPTKYRVVANAELTARPPASLRLAAEDGHYFRDVYDHVIRISEMVDSYRDLLSSALDVYLSTVSNRLNAVMKQLTVIPTGFLPLTFITGFFGQNFGWLTGHIQHWGTFVRESRHLMTLEPS
jgi:Mg2+ and Co2+ transporter CorA